MKSTPLEVSAHKIKRLQDQEHRTHSLIICENSTVYVFANQARLPQQKRTDVNNYGGTSLVKLALRVDSDGTQRWVAVRVPKYESFEEFVTNWRKRGATDSIPALRVAYGLHKASVAESLRRAYLQELETVKALYPDGSECYQVITVTDDRGNLRNCYLAMNLRGGCDLEQSRTRDTALWTNWYTWPVSQPKSLEKFRDILHLNITFLEDAIRLSRVVGDVATDIKPENLMVDIEQRRLMLVDTKGDEITLTLLPFSIFDYFNQRSLDEILDTIASNKNLRDRIFAHQLGQVLAELGIVFFGHERVIKSRITTRGKEVEYEFIKFFQLSDEQLETRLAILPESVKAIVKEYIKQVMSLLSYDEPVDYRLPCRPEDVLHNLKTLLAQLHEISLSSGVSDRAEDTADEVRDARVASTVARRGGAGVTDKAELPSDSPLAEKKFNAEDWLDILQRIADVKLLEQYLGRLHDSRFAQIYPAYAAIYTSLTYGSADLPSFLTTQLMQLVSGWPEETWAEVRSQLHSNSYCAVMAKTKVQSKQGSCLAATREKPAVEKRSHLNIFQERKDKKDTPEPLAFSPPISPCSTTPTPVARR